MSSTELLRNTARAAISAAVAVAFLAGCDTLNFSLGKKIDYKSSGSAPMLEVPPDLTTPTYDDRYQITTASGVAAARAAGRSTELLPVTADARIVRSGSERWLEVKTTQEGAWATLQDFWTKNGFVIAVDQPSLGIMETDWAENRADVPKDFLQQFSSKYISFGNDTYKRDKFRSRIERGTEPGTIDIFVSHRGAAQLPTKISQGAGEDWVWTPMPPNPEIEAEFLERLMLAFGAPAPQAAQAVTAMSNAPDRARIEKVDGQSKLVVDDAFDRAWRRVGLALDRTGFTVVDRDRSKGLYFVRYSNPDLEKQKKDEGWFKTAMDKLQFWKTDKPETPEQYRVVVTQTDPTSLVTVQDPSGVADHSPNGEKILALLKDQLK